MRRRGYALTDPANGSVIWFADESKAKEWLAKIAARKEGK